MLLQIRDKLSEACEAANKAELILTETFDEFALNESLSCNDFINILKPEVIDDPQHRRIIRWLCDSVQISRKLDIVNDYLKISKEILHDIDEELFKLDELVL